MKRFLFTVLLSLSLFGSQGLAQSMSVETRQALNITGRVVASGGNFPIANARVMARAVGVGGGPSSAQMVDQDGLAIMMVTHDHELAARFAHRSLAMKDGTVVEAQTSDNGHEQLNHEFLRHLAARTA